MNWRPSRRRRRAQAVQSFQRKRPSRKPFPDHLPRERVVVPAPESCPCCGSRKLSKLGEDITETLEVIPRQWKVIQTVREKFSCRDCETIAQPPAPFHVTPRGFAGPNLLAMILFEKFGQHQPLNRQSERYAREGIELSLSTLADQVGACATVLQPLHALIERACAGPPSGCTATTPPCRSWPRARRSRGISGPMCATTGRSAGAAPPAALYYASRDRRHEHPVRHLQGLQRHPAGRRLWRLQRAVRRLARAGAGHVRAVLGARQPAVLRARRHRGQCPARQEGGGDLAGRAGGGQADRRAVRHRARHQRQ